MEGQLTHAQNDLTDNWIHCNQHPMDGTPPQETHAAVVESQRAKHLPSFQCPPEPGQ